MITLTETQIKKLARDLLSAPQTIEKHSTYIKLLGDDFKDDFQAIQQEVLRLVKEGFREFDHLEDLTDASYKWVLDTFDNLDLLTKISCLDRGIETTNEILIVLALQSLVVSGEKFDPPLNTTILVSKMNRIIRGHYPDSIKVLAWKVLKQADGYEAIHAKDWKAYALRFNKKD